MTKRKNLACGLAAAFAAATLSVAGVAQAHPRLVSASPVPNATIVAPSRLTLNFSEGLVGPLSGGELYASQGNRPMRVNGVRATLAPNGKTLVFAAGRRLARGAYRLDWHAVSVDTHHVHGTLAFNVK